MLEEKEKKHLQIEYFLLNIIIHQYYIIHLKSSVSETIDLLLKNKMNTI